MLRVGLHKGVIVKKGATPLAVKFVEQLRECLPQRYIGKPPLRYVAGACD